MSSHLQQQTVSNRVVQCCCTTGVISTGCCVLANYWAYVVGVSHGSQGMHQGVPSIYISWAKMVLAVQLLVLPYISKLLQEELALKVQGRCRTGFFSGSPPHYVKDEAMLAAPYSTTHCTAASPLLSFIAYGSCNQTMLGMFPQEVKTCKTCLYLVPSRSALDVYTVHC